MKHEKITLRRFQRKFRDEKACVRHLFRLRWPDGYRCPKCGNRRYSFHSVRNLYQCGKCKYQVSVTAGTIFHKTRTPLAQWFWMIFVMTRQKSGASMLSLQGMLGIKSYKTVWTMSHKIRKAMADRDAQHQLTGVVETLKTPLRSSRKSSNAKEIESGPSIEVAVEDRGNSPGLAAMRYFPPAAQDKIMGDGRKEAVLAEEAPSEARIDQREELVHDAYDELNPLLIGNRKRKRVRWARILLANLTGNIRGVHHGVSEKHLHRYLAEFMFRFNRREWGSQLLDRALVACILAHTITYAELNS